MCVCVCVCVCMCVCMCVCVCMYVYVYIYIYIYIYIYKCVCVCVHSSQFSSPLSNIYQRQSCIIISVMKIETANVNFHQTYNIS